MSKNIIKQHILFGLSKLFYWVPDSIMLRVQYRIKMGQNLNLDRPERFTEKIQLYKIRYRNKEMHRCVDKYSVRQYVEEKLRTPEYLNELYQIADDAKDICFSNLPDRFVIKTTDGGDGDNILICKDKRILDISSAIKTLNNWKGKKLYKVSREWAYSGLVRPQLIVEKYLEDPSNEDGSIDDYKFLCFNGKFKCLWVDKNRYSKHQRGFWNEKLEYLDNISCIYPNFVTPPSLPINIDKMITLSEVLAKDFPLARVDWYNIKGKIIFGEITFYPCSGYMPFSDSKFDYELGSYFEWS